MDYKNQKRNIFFKKDFKKGPFNFSGGEHRIPFWGLL
jgi:hypothetical protein